MSENADTVLPDTKPQAPEDAFDRIQRESAEMLARLERGEPLEPDGTPETGDAGNPPADKPADGSPAAGAEDHPSPTPPETAAPEPGRDAPAKEEGKPDGTGDGAEPGNDLEQLRRKMRERDGRYGSELEKHRKTEAELASQIDSLKKEVESLKSAKSAGTAPPAPSGNDGGPTDEELRQEFTPEEIEENGRDWCVAEWKRAQRLAGKASRMARDEVRREMEREAANDRMAGFVKRLEAAVPGAVEIDRAAALNGFADYLDGEHADTGLTRRRILAEALQTIASGATGAELERAERVSTNIYRSFATPPEQKKAAPEANGGTGTDDALKPKADMYRAPATSRVTRVQAGTRRMTEAEWDRQRKAAILANDGEKLTALMSMIIRGEVGP